MKMTRKRKSFMLLILTLLVSEPGRPEQNDCSDLLGSVSPKPALLSTSSTSYFTLFQKFLTSLEEKPEPKERLFERIFESSSPINPIVTHTTAYEYQLKLAFEKIITDLNRLSPQEWSSIKSNIENLKKSTEADRTVKEEKKKTTGYVISPHLPAELERAHNLADQSDVLLTDNGDLYLIYGWDTQIEIYLKRKSEAHFKLILQKNVETLFYGLERLKLFKTKKSLYLLTVGNDNYSWEYGLRLYSVDLKAAEIHLEEEFETRMNHREVPRRVGFDFYQHSDDQIFFAVSGHTVFKHEKYSDLVRGNKIYILKFDEKEKSLTKLVDKNILATFKELSLTHKENALELYAISDSRRPLSATLIRYDLSQKTPTSASALVGDESTSWLKSLLSYLRPQDKKTIRIDYDVEYRESQGQSYIFQSSQDSFEVFEIKEGKPALVLSLPTAHVIPSADLNPENKPRIVGVRTFKRADQSLFFFLQTGHNLEYKLHYGLFDADKKDIQILSTAAEKQYLRALNQFTAIELHNKNILAANYEYVKDNKEVQISIYEIDHQSHQMLLRSTIDVKVDRRLPIQFELIRGENQKDVYLLGPLATLIKIYQEL